AAHPAAARLSTAHAYVGTDAIPAAEAIESAIIIAPSAATGPAVIVPTEAGGCVATPIVAAIIIVVVSIVIGIATPGVVGRAITRRDPRRAVAIGARAAVCGRGRIGTIVIVTPTRGSDSDAHANAGSSVIPIVVVIAVVPSVIAESDTDRESRAAPTTAVGSL